MASISLDRAYLIAIWLETLFYGVNLSLFCSYLLITRIKKRSHSLHKPLFFTAIFMFLCSTAHVSLGFARLIEGFIVLRDQPGGPGEFFSDVSIPANVAKVTIHTINSILGDSIMVWRCYHVWGRSWLMSMGPILLVAASAVCGFGQVHIYAKAKNIHDAFESELARWNGSLVSLFLATNLIVSCLIGFRIWYLCREFAFHGATNYRKIILVIVESGVVYSSALVIEITLYFLGNNAFYIVYDPIAQLTAIVPTIIIIFTTLGITSKEFAQTQTKQPSRVVVESPLEFSEIDDITRTHSLRGPEIPLPPFFTPTSSHDEEVSCKPPKDKLGSAPLRPSPMMRNNNTHRNDDTVAWTHIRTF